MLTLSNISAGYGSSSVLFGLSLQIAAGEIVTLLGRNGMGKTTTVRSIMGMVAVSGGDIQFDGVPTRGLPPHKIAKLGVGLVPEGRRIFPNLSVKENLLMMSKHGDWDLERVLGLFPRLAERLDNGGNQLSGGEQQMLAIGRALMTNPRLLILDEATEGLAPVVRDEIWATLGRLKAAGLTMLVIDKEIKKLAKLATRHYVIEKGEVVWSGNSADLQDNPIVERAVGL